MKRQTKQQRSEGGKRRMDKGHRENVRAKITKVRLREEREKNKSRPTK